MANITFKELEVGMKFEIIKEETAKGGYCSFGFLEGMNYFTYPDNPKIGTILEVIDIKKNPYKSVVYENSKGERCESYWITFRNNTKSLSVIPSKKGKEKLDLKYNYKEYKGHELFIYDEYGYSSIEVKFEIRNDKNMRISKKTMKFFKEESNLKWVYSEVENVLNDEWKNIFIDKLLQKEFPLPSKNSISILASGNTLTIRVNIFDNKKVDAFDLLKKILLEYKDNSDINFYLES